MRLSAVIAMPAMAASAVLALQRVGEIVERPRLDGAADGELGADRPRQVDVEAGEVAVRVEKIEGREIVGGDEANGLHGARRRPFHAPLGVPEIRDRHARGAIRRGGRQCRRAVEPFAEQADRERGNCNCEE